MKTLRDLKYLKDKNEKILNEYGISTFYDLLKFYPKKYEIYELCDFLMTNQNKMTLKGIISNLTINRFHKVESFSFDFQTGKYLLKVFAFNRNFLLRELSENQEIVLYGGYNSEKNIFNLEQIFLEHFENHIRSIYDIKGISDKMISKYLGEILQMNLKITELLPSPLLQKHQLVSGKDFLNMIHFPQNKAQIARCYQKLKYIEGLQLYLTVNENRFKDLIHIDPISFDMKEVKDFIQSLSFTLTEDQKSAINDIFRDLKKETPIQRMIEADVGSGKTILVVIAALAVSKNYQVCYVAPTEGLARQVFEVFSKHLENRQISLLTASTKNSEKIRITEEIKEGTIQILISTHSAFQHSLKFKNLRLVVMDEEQRFGIKQKEILQKKNPKAHTLFLSATPIPKTLAMTLLNDFEISQIRTKPVGRKKVETIIINPEKKEKIYQKIQHEISLKHQIYVICPLIRKNDTFEKSNIEEVFEEYQNRFLGYANVDFIHSKLKNDLKNRKLEDFYANKIQILISTTLVEVGIDNPNATLIVIYNSEQFGLSTLHQLRGRVGRNQMECSCLFVTEKDDNERLKILEKTDNCFELSEFDLKFRGPGEFLGLKQSGKLDLKYINFFKDIPLLQLCKEDGIYLLENHLLETKDYQNLAKSTATFKKLFENK